MFLTLFIVGEIFGYLKRSYIDSGNNEECSASRQCMPGELPIDGPPGGIQPAVSAAAGRRGLPAAVGARVRARYSGLVPDQSGPVRPGPAAPHRSLLDNFYAPNEGTK